MTVYTVTYTRNALQTLARLWLNAINRNAVTRAGDSIDQILRGDAPRKGAPIGAVLRQLTIAPIVVEFTVDEGNRLVTIWSTRHVGELTNGH